MSVNSADNSTYSDRYLRCLDAGLNTFGAAYAASCGEEMTVKAVAVIKADRARRAKATGDQLREMDKLGIGRW